MLIRSVFLIGMKVLSDADLLKETFSLLFHSWNVFICIPLFQPGTFPYKEDIMSTNNMCLVFAVLLFIGCILSFKVSS